MIAAVLPIKRFDAAKSRLADALATPDRRRLARAMFADALAAIGASDRIGRVIVVSGEPEIAKDVHEAGAELLLDPTDSSHSAAALLGVERSIEEKCEAVALLPGDCPLLDPSELDRAIDALSAPGVVVIPDRHGTGTNGLLLRPPDAIRPSFGPGSHARHLALAAAASVPARSLALYSLGLDADTGEDLEVLRQAVSEAPAGVARRTALALASIETAADGS